MRSFITTKDSFRCLVINLKEGAQATKSTPGFTVGVVKEAL